MPIEVASEVRLLNQEEFHALHRRVLGIIFEVHNEFGRFLDELLFKREIAARCQESGLAPAEREVRIRVRHDTFCKDYFLDLFFCHGLPAEVKAAEAFAPSHRAQAFNYLLLMGLQHGMLVNLRPERVQQQFVSTGLTPEKRRRFSIKDKGWRGVDERSALLMERMVALLQDWGAFLEIALYREALVHFLGKAPLVIQRVPICSGQRILGEQSLHLLNPETAFSLSAVAGDTSVLRDHQERFLRHTSLRTLQWINLNHHQIEFTTLVR